MKKLFLVFIFTIFFVSCSFNNNKSENDTNQDQLVSGVVEESTGIIDNSGVLDGSGNILDDETGSGNNENSDSSLLDKSDINLTIEEQYCKSKGGKTESVGDRKVCFITDEIGLLKCDVNVFYQDMCRDKSVKLENGVIVDFVKPVVKVIQNTEVKNIKKDVNVIQNQNVKDIDKDQGIDKSNDEKKLFVSQINLGTGFVFKQDDTSKYLYLGEKLIVKIDSSGKILMGLNNGNIYPFNIYFDKSDIDPSKVINVDISNASFTEKVLKTEVITSTGNLTKNEDSNTGTIDKNTSTKSSNNSALSPILKSSTGLTGTYYMTNTSLKVQTSSGETITLFSSKDVGTGSIDIDDFELMVNKQVKVFYYPGNSKVRQEKIIDLNNIIK
ncbi:MAG: hypothetical protein PHS49_06165 [Candidatus Gracilibacteria bacterium]|nr:hypothetical protein [Candidatus Gracilibacteria bacterium]